MEDLQALLEKINREGVEKAEGAAQKIIAEANAKAAAIIKSAREDAAAAKAEAEKAAADYAARAAETVKEAARDVVLGVKDAITASLEKLLAKDVEKALADEATAKSLVEGAIKDLTGKGEIVCGPKLAKTLAAQLALKDNFTLVTDETVESGFTVRLDGGRVEHAFTAEVIAGELAKRLRPDLAALVK